MSEKLVALAQKIDALQLRERVLILLCVLAIVVMLLQSVLIDPMLNAKSIMQRETKTLNQSIAQQKNEQQIISAELTAGVNRNKIKRRDQLQQELTRLNTVIDESVIAMIPPRLMPQVLESILAQNENLKLLAVENKPVISVIENIAGQMAGNSKKDEAAGKVSKNNGHSQVETQALFRHSFIIKLQGDYLSAIDYFKKLEQLPWRFYWDQLDLKVDKYPSSIITLEVHTVSMSEEWIGV